LIIRFSPFNGVDIVVPVPVNNKDVELFLACSKSRGAKRERCPMKSRISGTVGPCTYFPRSIFHLIGAMATAFILSKRLKT
jgi:hypothetical protein